MLNRRLTSLFALAIAFSGACAVAQVSSKPEKTKTRQEVVIVGASVSAGFADPTSKGDDGKVNRTYRLDVAFKKAWPRTLARVANFSDLRMFMAPELYGKNQLASAKKRKPDLLIGIDLMVWFGYGSTYGKVKKGEVDTKRIALQAKGLALLGDFKCPVILGDYPDMHGASSHMLPQRMIPNVVTLAALNNKLREWAKAHKNVTVFPLANFVKEAVTKKQTYPFGKGKVIEFPKNFLLQSDRLHATRVGTLVVVLRLAQALQSILPAKHPLLGPKVTFKGLIEAAGLVDDIPEPTRIKTGN